MEWKSMSASATLHHSSRRNVGRNIVTNSFVGTDDGAHVSTLQ
jgi:hypothetical protein